MNRRAFLGSASPLYDYEEKSETIAKKAMKIAAEICVDINDQLTIAMSLCGNNPADSLG